MTRRNQDFMLGTVILAMLALFLGTFLFLYPLARVGGQLITVHFPSTMYVAPLTAGSPVMISGAIQIGAVKSVALQQVATPQLERAAGGPLVETVIVVIADINENVPLNMDCIFATDQPPVGGGGMLVLLDVGTPGKPLPPGTPIRGQPAASLNAAIGQLSRRLLAPGGMVDRIDVMLDPRSEGSAMFKVYASLNDLNAMTAELRNQLTPSERLTLLGKLNGLLDDLNATTGALREQTSLGNGAGLLTKVHSAFDKVSEGLSEATELLKSSKPPLLGALASIERATATLERDMITPLAAEFRRDDAAALLAKLHVAMDSVTSSLAELEKAAGAGQRLVALNAPAVEETLENVREMSEELRRASLEVRLNPSKLIWGPEPEQKQKTPVFEAARNFAEAATQLDQAAARLEAVWAASESRGSAAADADLQMIRDAVKASFERFRRAETYLYDKMK
ncbi:hypothetical protein RAS1_00130 [Phycisphaerae bacterium RAS1]|nr:hypothetical protein RAS1_00130 [Phycisphaerae bacterium RAS1]